MGVKVAVVNEGRIPSRHLLAAVHIDSCRQGHSPVPLTIPVWAIAWQKNLPAGLSVGGTLTGTSLSDEGVRRAWYGSAVSVGIPLPARLAGFVEIYAVSSEGPGNGSTWISDAGLTRNFGPDLQIDIEAGRRLSSGRLAGLSQRDLRCDTLYSDADGNGADPSGTQLMFAAVVRHADH